jgi:hypothetical protein
MKVTVRSGDFSRTPLTQTVPVTKRTPIACVTGALLAALLLSGCHTWAGAQPQFVEQGSPSPRAAVHANSRPLQSTADPAASVSTRNVTEVAEIPYSTEEIDDPTLDEGVRRVLTMGVPGAKRLTYRLTFIGGRQSDKMLVRSQVTKRPVGMVVAVGTRPPAKPGHDCNANYSGCVPVAVDVDCAGGGNGPVYLHGAVKVVGIDIYHLDLNSDGRACSGPDDIP